MCVGFEVLKEVMVKIQDFWDINAFIPVKS